MEQNAKLVEFMPPKDWAPPETTGEEFDQVCTFRKKPDGQICLIMLGDTKMAGYDKNEAPHDESAENPNHRSYAKDMGLGESLGEQSQSPQSY